MKAFVINEDQIKTAGLVVAAIIVTVFLLGYFLGAKQNMPAGPVSKVAVKETQDAATTSFVTNAAKLEKVKAENKQSKNKNNKTENKKESKKTEKKTTTKKVSASQTANKKPAKKITEKKVLSQKKQPKKIQTEDKAANTTDKKTTAQTKPAASKTAADDKDKAASAKRVYSIQAGMFSNEMNAKSFIEKLSAKTFDAYLSSFVSSSGAIKYNVRVGKFAQRNQARERLKVFQKSFSSPAYVVISQP